MTVDLLRRASLIALLLVPGGSALLLAVWARRRWIARDRHRIDVALAARGARLTARLEAQEHDEDLRKRTEARRQTAEKIRGRARKVESGAPVSDVLRAVK